MHMYCWSLPPFFIAVAQAINVVSARALVLEQIGLTEDDTDTVHKRAYEWVQNNSPTIWYGHNAEFALTDSAELEEAENQITKLQAQIKHMQTFISCGCQFGERWLPCKKHQPKPAEETFDVEEL